MTTELIALLGALITACISALTVIYQTRRKQTQVDAGAAESITDAAQRVVEMQSAQIDKLAKQVESLNCEMDKLRKYVRMFRKGVKDLVHQLEEVGIEPVFDPDDLPPIEDVE